MNTHYTTLTNDDGADIPVVIEYSVTGYREVEVLAVRGDMPGEPGPDIRYMFDDNEIEHVVQTEIVRNLPWRKLRDTDLPNYAPQREL